MRARKRMPNGAAAEARDSVRLFPGFSVQAEEKKPHWLFRTAVWSGVIMSTPENPKGWTFNPSTVTLALVVAGMIAAGSYYLGAKDAELKILQRQIDAYTADAAKAKQLETYNAGSVDAMKGHTNSNTEKKK